MSPAHKARAGSLEGRAQRAVESFSGVREAVGPIEKNMSLFCVTRGQWSMIDAILYCLDQVGPSRVSVWTWTVAEYEVQTLARLRDDERIISGRLVIDHGARNKNASLIADWKRKFGAESVRYVLNHAKIATISSCRTTDARQNPEGFNLLLRGSMNLNFNPRFENFDISEGGAAFELVRGIEETLPVLPDSASGADVYKASNVSAAFGAESLAMFKGARVWAK